MENNLYYTPEISEFNVGFEYEIKIKDNWRKKSTTISDFSPISDYDGMSILEEDLISNIIRVKTLDQSDIESLGWRFGTNDYVFPENKNVTYGQYKLLFNNSELEIIHLSGTVFRGTIKNKSELIKLQQQLNIK